MFSVMWLRLITKVPFQFHHFDTVASSLVDSELCSKSQSQTTRSQDKEKEIYFYYLFAL